MSVPQIFKASSLAFKDIDTKQGIVSGYFASFGTLDSDGDIFAPDAFNKSIQDCGPKSKQPRIKHLLDHDKRNAVAVINELYPDNFGLAYTSKAGTHTAGQDFLKMCLDGIITEHSVGINYIADKMRPQEDGSVILMEVKLWEGSSLQFLGANQFTPVTSVKSAEELVDYLITLNKCLKNGTYSDEAFIELEKLHTTVGNILKSKTTEPEPVAVATQPNVPEAFDTNKFLQELSTALKTK